jgi:hypothetical protein
VRVTFCPGDGVSTVSCSSLLDVANCLCAKEIRTDGHAGRVARVVVQALEKRRLLHTRLLSVDIMTGTETIAEEYNDCLNCVM